MTLKDARVILKEMKLLEDGWGSLRDGKPIYIEAIHITNQLLTKLSDYINDKFTIKPLIDGTVCLAWSEGDDDDALLLGLAVCKHPRIEWFSNVYSDTIDGKYIKYIRGVVRFEDVLDLVKEYHILKEVIGSSGK